MNLHSYSNSIISWRPSGSVDKVFSSQMRGCEFNPSSYWFLSERWRSPVTQQDCMFLIAYFRGILSSTFFNPPSENTQPTSNITTITRLTSDQGKLCEGTPMRRYSVSWHSSLTGRTQSWGMLWPPTMDHNSWYSSHILDKEEEYIFNTKLEVHYKET